MDMLDVSVTLIVKAPNQQIEDQTIKCETTWSIHKLKGYLAEVYPSKPRTEDQKLIYSGQLLPDTVILKDVLRQYEGQETHTVHLVCSASRESMKRSVPSVSRTSVRMNEARTDSTTAIPAGEGPQSATNVDASSDGLRQRLAAGNVTSPSPSTSYHYNANAAGFPASDPRAMWTAAMTHPYPGGYDPNQMTQQLIYMQQMYHQYLTNYMQMMAANSGPVPFSPAGPAQAAQPAAQEQPPADNPEQADPQPEENPNIPDGEEEEGRGNRDWLDWFYILSRVMVLFSIVYFYSSPTRFIIVSALGLIMYLYQIGFFRAQQIQAAAHVLADNNNLAAGARAGGNNNLAAGAGGNNNLAAAAGGNNNLRNNQEAAAAAAEPNEDQPPREEAAAAAGTEPPQDGREPPGQEERPPLLALTWTFLSSFFASLIPEQPGV